MFFFAVFILYNTIVYLIKSWNQVESVMIQRLY